MTIDTEMVYTLDLLGTACFAVSGALRAVRRRPDIVGMTILAGVAALGGGVLRDVILDRPVGMLADPNYLLVILVSAVVCFFFWKRIQRVERALKYFDAIGLGVFSAVAAMIAQSAGLNWLSVLFIAAVSGTGGGIGRDVMMSHVPLVLYREIYVSAVVAGAAGLLIVDALGGTPLAGFCTALVLTTGIRVLAIRTGMQLPRLRVHTHE